MTVNIRKLQDFHPEPDAYNENVESFFPFKYLMLLSIGLKFYLAYTETYLKHANVFSPVITMTVIYS